MSEGEDLDLPELESGDGDDGAQPSATPSPDASPGDGEGEDAEHTPVATDLEAVFDVPVNISAVLGRTSIGVSDLLKLDTGTVVELDRKVGEAIDIYVNNRLVARGEVVIVEERLGVTMTEIIKSDRG